MIVSWLSVFVRLKDWQSQSIINFGRTILLPRNWVILKGNKIVLKIVTAQPKLNAISLL